MELQPVLHYTLLLDCNVPGGPGARRPWVGHVAVFVLRQRPQQDLPDECVLLRAGGCAHLRRRAIGQTGPASQQPALDSWAVCLREYPHHLLDRVAPIFHQLSGLPTYLFGHKDE